MNVHTFTPTWRKCADAIQLVTAPSKEWFDGLTADDSGRQFFRISVLNDGEIYFGDAHVVLHQDIMRARPNKDCDAILVAVFLRKNSADQWRIANAQHWGTLASAGSLASTRAFLSRLRAWDDIIVPALGNDPLELPSLEEEFWK